MLLPTIANIRCKLSGLFDNRGFDLFSLVEDSDSAFLVNVLGFANTSDNDLVLMHARIKSLFLCNN
jgi:hypothetical protein